MMQACPRYKERKLVEPVQWILVNPVVAFTSPMVLALPLLLAPCRGLMVVAQEVGGGSSCNCG